MPRKEALTKFKNFLKFCMQISLISFFIQAIMDDFWKLTYRTFNDVLNWHDNFEEKSMNGRTRTEIKSDLLATKNQLSLMLCCKKVFAEKERLHYINIVHQNESWTEQLQTLE